MSFENKVFKVGESAAPPKRRGGLWGNDIRPSLKTCELCSLFDSTVKYQYYLEGIKVNRGYFCDNCVQVREGK